MDKFSILNAALSLTGNNKVKQGDHTPQMHVADCHYDLCVEAALERSPWSFARRTAYLDALVDGDFEWDRGALLPEDSIKARNLYLLPKGADPKDGIDCYRCDDWEEIDCKIYWGRKGDWSGKYRGYIEYTARVPEERWSPTFRKGMMLRMASVFARSLNEESGEAQDLSFQADLAFGFAAMKSTQRKHQSDPDSRKMGRIMQARLYRNRRRRYGAN